MRKMLENGVHFGHQTRKWNPKMKPYIYTAKNGIYIIDLAKTETQLDAAYAALKAITENGGKTLFVGTKKQAQAPILEEALRSGSFYVNQRWLGGTLTNFRTIQKSIKRLLEIEEMETSGTINVYTKKEQAVLLKKKDRLDNFLGGIKEMKKLPDAVFVIDPIEEHNAVEEANKLNIPVFALIDTNADPTAVKYPVPANDDAVRSIKLMTGLMADAIVEAKGGVLEFAYQEDQTAEDITMKDVMINVEQQAAEYEKRRRAKFEERRQAMLNGSAPRRPYNGGNTDRRSFHRDYDGNRAAVAAAQAKFGQARTMAASAPAAAAAKAAEVKTTVTTAAAKVEEKAAEVKTEVKTAAAEIKSEAVKAHTAVKADAEAAKNLTAMAAADLQGKAENLAEKAETEVKKVRKTAVKAEEKAEEVKEKVKKTATAAKKAADDTVKAVKKAAGKEAE